VLQQHYGLPNRWSRGSTGMAHLFGPGGMKHGGDRRRTFQVPGASLHAPCPTVSISVHSLRGVISEHSTLWKSRRRGRSGRGNQFIHRTQGKETSRWLATPVYPVRVRGVRPFFTDSPQRSQSRVLVPFHQPACSSTVRASAFEAEDEGATPSEPAYLSSTKPHVAQSAEAPV
jgi:hypothetical protein